MGSIWRAARCRPRLRGRKIIERSENRLGLSELEFLLAAGDERIGALAFATERKTPLGRPTPPVARLAELVDAAARVERDEPVSVELLTLLGAGTGTLGGMRPKATVEDRGRLWIAKLPSREDRYAITRWEHAALELAARCGLNVPDRRLALVGRRPVLLVARFDRRSRGKIRERAHFLSGLTMLGLHERDYGRGSYADLSLWLRRYGIAPREDARELYCRMAFNILIGNTDDHLRNHAVINFGDGLRLSPLYDVMPWPATGSERIHAIGVGRQGRLATIENALSDAGLFGFERKDAESEVRRIQGIVRAEWEAIFKSAGIIKRELSTLAEVLAPDGIRTRAGA